MTTIGEGAVLAGEQRRQDRRTAILEQIVAVHQARVRRLAHRLLGWQRAADDVDDVVQNVFLKTLAKMNALREPAELGPWLTRVTINACRTQRRKDWVRLRWLRSHHADAIADAADASALQDETSERVRSAVRSLSTADREVIVLFYLEQMSVAQIAELLNVKANAIEVRLHRARQRLKDRLNDLMPTDK